MKESKLNLLQCARLNRMDVPREKNCSLVEIRALRRRHCFGGGAPAILVQTNRRRRRGVGGKVPYFRILASTVFQQRTFVIKVCMWNNFFLRLSGLKFEKNIIKQAFSNKTKQAEVHGPSSSTSNRTGNELALFTPRGDCKTEKSLLRAGWRRTLP